MRSSTPDSWERRACKDMVPQKLENKPSPDGKMMSNMGLGYAIGPDKIPTVFANEQNFWNGTPQIITYCFMEGNELQHEKVTQAIDEWTWYANVVFMQASSAEESNVRVTFDPKDGSWSYIGRQCNNVPLSEATMNLAWLDKFAPITANERAVILHEFGHALGLLHEHQSPSHGNKAIQDIRAALELYRKTPGWPMAQIFEQVINVYNKSDITNYSQVDVQSIMHYPQPRELTCLEEDVPYNEKLSDLDKAYMILQYPRKTMHPQAMKDGWSIERALEVIGAPPDVTGKILTFVKEDVDDFGEISPARIREATKNWTRAMYGHVEDGGQMITTRLRGARPPDAGSPHVVADGLDGNPSRFNKPVVVNESEFTLTDGLYPASPIVGGPDGQILSQKYEKALNGIIPTFESVEVRKQREKMRKWLLKEIKAGPATYAVDTPSTIPGLSIEVAKKLSEIYGMNITAGNQGAGPMADQAEAMLMTKQAIEAVQNSKEEAPRGMSRMEFSESLMEEYLRERQAWEEQKDKMISEASDLPVTDPQAMDDLTRRLANDAALENAKARAKYDDAIVGRYGHTLDGMPVSTPRRAAPKPGDIVEALRVSLRSGEFADWARQQPEDVKDGILAAMMEAFGKSADGKQG